MKITYNQILSGKNIPKSQLYLIHGDPYHLLNDIQNVIFPKSKNEKNTLIHYIDSDFTPDDIRQDIESKTLFSDKTNIVLNVLTSSIPKKLASYIQEINIPDDVKIILKINNTNFSFKKTKFFSFVEKEHMAIEVKPLVGKFLNEWIISRFKKHSIKFTTKSLDLMKEAHDGDSSAIAQEIYKISIIGNNDLDLYLENTHKSSKFSELDLIDSMLDNNNKKSLKIFKYLQQSNFSEVYLLQILQLEVRKIISCKVDISPEPYIPSFKIDKYHALSEINDIDYFYKILSICSAIDSKIKSSTEKNYIWNSLKKVINLLSSSNCQSILSKDLVLNEYS